MSAQEPRRRPVAEIVCGALLVTLFALGAALPTNPDFDGTFGLEAWRSHGWGAFWAAAAGLSVVLLVPRVAVAAERAAASVARALPAAARPVLLLAAAATAYVLLTDRSLSGDGVGVVYGAARGHVPGSSLLAGGVLAAAVRVLPVEPREAVRSVSCAVGVLYAGLALWAGRAAFARAADRVACTALLLTCGGAAVFFGSVEMYALPVAGTLLFLVVALRRADGVEQRPWAALALGTLATVHGSLLALAPALAHAVWCAPGARRTVRALVPHVVAFAAPPVVVTAAVWLLVWDGRAPGAASLELGNVLGAQGQSPFLPLLPSSFNVNHRYAALGVEHLVGVANVVFLVCPVGLALALVGRSRGPRATLLALAAAGLVGLALVWNVTYALRRDWDLFAPLGVALALLGAVRFLGTEEVPGRAARIVALCLFAFAPQVLANTGERVQRRAYANEVVEAYELLSGDDSLDAARRASLAAPLARWRAESRALDPHDVVRTLRSAWGALRGGDLATVERAADAVLSVEPGNADSLHLRGEALLSRGRVDAAREQLEASLRRAREDLRPRTRRMLARIELDAGRTAAAAAQLERGLREEMLWDEEALALMRALAALRRDQARIAEAEWLDRMIERRTRTGLK